jgi:hypothetical protein
LILFDPYGPMSGEESKVVTRWQRVEAGQVRTSGWCDDWRPMALYKRQRWHSASGGARDSCPSSWARNGPIRPAAVGLMLGKEKERK